MAERLSEVNMKGRISKKEMIVVTANSLAGSKFVRAYIVVKYVCMYVPYVSMLC